MDQEGSQMQPFEPEDSAAAADDPFLNALVKTRDRVAQLAEVFASQDTPAADPRVGAGLDPAPMSSRDLYEI
jgi:hypothetical protein